MAETKAIENAIRRLRDMEKGFAAEVNHLNLEVKQLGQKLKQAIDKGDERAIKELRADIVNSTKLAESNQSQLLQTRKKIAAYERELQAKQK